MARRGLQGTAVAGRAGGAQVQPVAVTVQAILYVVLVYLYTVLFGEFSSLFPGGNFHLEQLYVVAVVGVVEQGMAQFVQ